MFWASYAKVRVDSIFYRFVFLFSTRRKLPLSNREQWISEQKGHFTQPINVSELQAHTVCSTNTCIITMPLCQEHSRIHLNPEWHQDEQSYPDPVLKMKWKNIDIENFLNYFKNTNPFSWSKSVIVQIIRHNMLMTKDRQHWQEFLKIQNKKVKTPTKTEWWP